jgi:hypothetical protein
MIRFSLRCVTQTLVMLSSHLTEIAMRVRQDNKQDYFEKIVEAKKILLQVRSMIYTLLDSMTDRGYGD